MWLCISGTLVRPSGHHPKGVIAFFSRLARDSRCEMCRLSLCCHIADVIEDDISEQHPSVLREPSLHGDLLSWAPLALGILCWTCLGALVR
mmetsp:Transcript_72386/g.182635  ORF Transcript_72386/g.182635 Transcript_72386/m.182635 type:complete len:91 (+) Transcript_72386:790-1062(+)